MKLRWTFVFLLAALVLSGVQVFADQLILKNGREYSGKLIRSDANVVEFRVAGKVETFKMADVSQIIIKEPEMVNPPVGRTLSNAPQPAEPVKQVPPEAPPVDPDARPPLTNSRTSSAAPATGGATVTLAAGMGLTIRMEESVDTERNRVGDSFRATLEEPISVGSQIILPRGSEVKGAIAYSRESGKVSGRSELILELTEIRANGKSYALQTSDYSEVGVSQGKKTAAAATGAAALGAVIGAIAGGGKGAAIGAVTGGAVGGGVAVLTSGQTLRVPAETILQFKLQKPLALDAP